MDGWMISYYRKPLLVGHLCELNHTLLSTVLASKGNRHPVLYTLVLGVIINSKWSR